MAVSINVKKSWMRDMTDVEASRYRFSLNRWLLFAPNPVDNECSTAFIDMHVSFSVTSFPKDLGRHCVTHDRRMIRANAIESMLDLEISHGFI